jgi:hypothetical protein
MNKEWKNKWISGGVTEKGGTKQCYRFWEVDHDLIYEFESELLGGNDLKGTVICKTIEYL